MDQYLARTEVRLRRGWLVGSKIVIWYGRVVLFCRNYGEVPAKVLSVKSNASYSDEFTGSDIRAIDPNISTTIIFPDKEHEFSAAGVEGIQSHRKLNIRFGFIIEYEYLPGNIGEYGVIGEIHQTDYGVSETTRQTEWSKEYGIRNRIRTAFSRMRNASKLYALRFKKARRE